MIAERQSVVFISARSCAALLHISMRVISMSAHVSYETLAMSQTRSTKWYRLTTTEE